MAIDREELRIAVIGGGAVGKSSMTVLMTSQKQVKEGEYDPTIEDAYFMLSKVDGAPVYLEILDTAGQDEYKALR